MLMGRNNTGISLNYSYNVGAEHGYLLGNRTMHIQSCKMFSAKPVNRENNPVHLQVPSQTLLTTIPDIQATMLLSQRTNGTI